MSINATDRGFQFGDGLFETIRVEQGQLIGWEFHSQRLLEGAKRLGIRLPAQRLLKMRCQSQAATVQADVAVLKLQVTRGDSAGGYAANEGMMANLYLTVRPLKFSDAIWRQGIRLRLCEQRLALQPSLAGIKHCNRLEQVLARREWSDPDIHEGLMLDTEGYVVEGVSSNLFAYIDGQWCTPLLDRCGVAGTMRARVCEWMAENGSPVLEQRLRLEDVQTADHLMLTNAVVGVWPVRQFDDEIKALHPDTDALQAEFSAFLNAADQVEQEGAADVS